MTRTLAADPDGIAAAARLLLGGGLVAFATETVYGLGADAADPAAVAALFRAKGRPSFNPLIAHYGDVESPFRDVEANLVAQVLAGRFWPGPLTLVLPRRPDCRVVPAAGAGLPTLAVRVPAHADARRLLKAVDRPVAAPSANRSGTVSPTTAAHVLAGLGGRIDAVLDSGACPVGVESTVLDLSDGPPRLLRPGGLATEVLEDAIGPLAGAAPGAPRAPGQLIQHYAPTLKLRLAADAVAPDEALLAFGPPVPGAALHYQLSAAGDLAEAASRLFAGLRTLDEAGQARGLAGIAAMAVPERGLGRAINDRLRRAAAS